MIDTKKLRKTIATYDVGPFVSNIIELIDELDRVTEELGLAMGTLESRDRNIEAMAEEYRRVLRAGRASGGKTGEVADAFHIALRTGMRLSEVLAAPVGFDKARRVVTLGKTKTGGRVEIPVGRIAAKLLDRPAFAVGANEASTLFSKLTRSQMIDGLTFHDARATALTLLARKVDVMVLARISRHKDLSLLHRVYYRASAEQIAAKL